MRLIARDQPIHPEDAPILAELQLTGMVLPTGDRLFSALFGTYVVQQAAEEMAGLVVDVRRRQIWVDGALLRQPVGPKEFELLVHLAQHVGEVCRTRDMLTLLFPEEQVPDHVGSDQRLDRIVSRLRTALGEQAHDYIVRRPKVGMQLRAGRLQ